MAAVPESKVEYQPLSTFNFFRYSVRNSTLLKKKKGTPRLRTESRTLAIWVAFVPRLGTNDSDRDSPPCPAFPVSLEAMKQTYQRALKSAADFGYEKESSEVLVYGAASAAFLTIAQGMTDQGCV